MNVIVNLFVFIGLLVGTVTDMKKKKIYIPFFIIAIGILLLIKLCEKDNLWEFVVAAGISFCCFYLFSIVTKGQIGKGDAYLFGFTGAGTGIFENFIIIYISFWLTFIVAVFLLIFKKVNKGYRIPLAPFILLSYSILCFKDFLLH